MSETDDLLRAVTRRHFFRQAGFGIGASALTALLNERLFAEGLAGDAAHGATRPPHFAPKAKSIIYLFMAGAPSQLDLFDHKPKLSQLRRPDHPRRVREGRALRLHQGQAQAARIAATRSSATASRAPRSRACCRTRRRSSTTSPSSGRSTRPVQPRPGPALHQHGRTRSSAGRAWGRGSRYGLGSECHDLPGFVVLLSGGGPARRRQVLLGQRLPADRLPGRAVPLPGRSGPLPVESRRRLPRGAPRARSTRCGDLNRAQLEEVGDPEIVTRIAPYEMAYRMQTSVPELMDISQGAEGDPRPVRHPAGQALVRQQLPPGPPARRARRALRPALPPRLGQPRHGQGGRHREPAAGSAAARPIRPRPPCVTTSSSAACSTTRSSSGAASSAARR